MRVILDHTLIRAEWYFNMYHIKFHVDGNLNLGCKILILEKDSGHEKDDTCNEKFKLQSALLYSHVDANAVCTQYRDYLTYL